MKQCVLLILLLLVSIRLSADLTVAGRAIIKNAENNESIKYPYELELLKLTGKNLNRYCLYTYLGLGIGLIGSILIASPDGDKGFGTAITIVGGIISLLAPAEVGSAGRKLEILAEYKFLELEKKRKVENKSKD